MLGKKEPVKIADVVSVFAPPEEVELPSGGTYPVRPLDALGYKLKQEIDADPDGQGERIYELVQKCLPTVPEQEILGLTPIECGVIVLIATGRIKEVQAMAEMMAGNVHASTMAAPELPKSPTPSDSSASASPVSSGAS